MQVSTLSIVVLHSSGLQCKCILYSTSKECQLLDIHITTRVISNIFCIHWISCILSQGLTV